MAKLIKITIVSDTVCPWCFIGKRRLEKAIRAVKSTDPDVNFEVKWEPYFLDPSLPKEGIVKMERYRAKFGEARVRQMLPYMQETGRAEGIAFDYGGLISNTLDSHRVIELAWQKGGAALQDKVVEALFQFYFEKQGNLGDAGKLVEVAASAGLDAEEVRSLLAGPALREEVVKHARDLPSKFSFSGVPFFIFGGGKFTLSGAQEATYFESVLRGLVEDLEA